MLRPGFAVVLALLISTGCGGGDSEPEAGGGAGGGGSGGAPSGGGSGGSSSGGSSSGGSPSGGSAGSGATASADRAVFDAILSGQKGASDGLSEIAKSEGFPIAVEEGFLFAALDDGKGPYAVAGDFDGWSGTPMKAEAGLHWVVIEIAAPDGQKYKLVDGAKAFVADPLARRYGYDELGEHSLVRASAPHLERWPRMAGNGLAERAVRVWVPADAPTHHLYAHDGQNLFDPAAAFGGWKLTASVGQKTLVVGIDNAGGARMEEYTHVADVIGGQSVGGKADAYAGFVLDTVRPLIEARYGKPARVGVLGSSLGGLVSFHQALRDPAAWDFAASLSGTFGWGSIGASNETLIQRFEKAPKLATKLYLDSGGGPGSGCTDNDADGTLDDSPDATDNYCETVQLRDALAAKGYAFGSELTHWWEPGAAHNEAAWAARVFRPLDVFEAL